MNKSVRQWFSDLFLDMFQSQIRHYRKSVTDRILPSFSRIEQEAEQFEAEEVERLSPLVNPEMDPSDFAEMVHDRAAEYYMSLSGIRQGMINLLSAGLFHLFEQQVTQFVDRSYHKPIGNKSLFVRFEEVLRVQNCDARSLPYWEKISNEFRLVANTVKHGPGDSANKLARVRPDFFRPEPLKTEPGIFRPLGDYATSPLSGEGLFLTEDDFKGYADAIIAFWDAFSCGEN